MQGRRELALEGMVDYAFRRRVSDEFPRVVSCSDERFRIGKHGRG